MDVMRDGRNAKRQFCALQCKDQLRDLNYLNQKITTTIDTLDGPTFENNLILSHQVDLCPQWSFQLKLLKITKSILQQKVGSIALLVW